MFDYFQYFILFTLVSALIIAHERKDFTRYIALGSFTVLCAAFAEPLGRLAGFWDYNVGPFLFGASVLTILNYFNYIVIVYFVSEKLCRRFSA